MGGGGQSTWSRGEAGHVPALDFPNAMVATGLPLVRKRPGNLKIGVVEHFLPLD